ncbi:capsule biosynthesis protein CapA [Rhodobacterales bacterium 52_120_T64]|nr:capsule biosynthesis protein CapA [Rhodobacterales bacterium 52_120_T64]
METTVLTPHRKFLFLQGPHGPFFRQLGAKIAATGASVSRIGFNRGDAVFWMRNSGFKPFNGTSEEWPAFLESFLTREGITDIVLYGDSRPIHTTAREIAKARGITAHCFEEGYLRPYWATYERGGTNGHSMLMDLSMDDIRRAVDAQPVEQPEVPVLWGSAWHHAFYGFLYHLFLSLPTRRFRNYRPHREVSVLTELWYYINKLAGMPLHGLQRRIRTRRLLRSGAIYHLVLLQLSHDASLRNHSDFKSVEEFIERVIAEFSVGAPMHHKLVFKAHPFEDGREPLPSIVRKVAKSAGISARVLYIPGGKLGPLLDSANSTVTVNSTAAQQALWRNLPVYALGRSVFSKPELVSENSLAEFFAEPDTPDAESYNYYRKFLLETSQIGGGYYTQRGRAELLRRLVDLMLANEDPYLSKLESQHTQSADVKLVGGVDHRVT